MKKILLAVLVLVMLAGAALAQETAGFSFATLGDAMASESYTGIAGGDDQHFNVVVTLNGAPHRLTADLDDKARELAEGTLESVEADAVEAAFEAYNAYIRTLPVTREEEITAQPKSREELEELVGKTLLEVEAAGYEHESSEMGADDTAVYTVSFGMYDYNLLLNETYTEYREHDENGYIGDLTVKSVSVAGLSRNAADLRYHADGTYDAENDAWGEYTALMEKITGALEAENPEEAVQALVEAMPEQEETIRMFAEIFASMSGMEPEEAAQPEDAFYIAPISDEIFARIEGKSFKEDCTLPREDLRYLHVLHVDLNGETREGEMIVNRHIAEDVPASISASFPTPPGSPSTGWAWRWISIRCTTLTRRWWTACASWSRSPGNLTWTGKRIFPAGLTMRTCATVSSPNTALNGAETGKTGRITSILRFRPA